MLGLWITQVPDEKKLIICSSLLWPEDEGEGYEPFEAVEATMGVLVQQALRGSVRSVSSMVFLSI